MAVNTHPLQTLTFEEVVARLRALDGQQPRIVISGNSATPLTLVQALAGGERCRVFQLNAQDGFVPPPATSARHPSSDRECATAPAGLPAHAAVARPPAVQHRTTGRRGAAPHLTARDGKVSLGIEVNILPAAIEQARARGGLVVAQMNPRMPYTFGDGEIPLESIDGFLEVDDPLTSPPIDGSLETAAAIGERVARIR